MPLAAMQSQTRAMGSQDMEGINGNLFGETE
jgi:hypothetical protein